MPSERHDLCTFEPKSIARRLGMDRTAANVALVEAALAAVFLTVRYFDDGPLSRLHRFAVNDGGGQQFVTVTYAAMHSLDADALERWLRLAIAALHKGADEVTVTLNGAFALP